MSDLDDGVVGERDPAETHLVGVGAHRVGLRHGAATDVGLVREANEDAYLGRPPVFVVADGMGGHDDGDIASRIVVEEFGRLADAGYDPRRAADVVTATLWQCQRRLEQYGETHRGPRRWTLAGRYDGRSRAPGGGPRTALAAGQPRGLPHLRVQRR